MIINISSKHAINALYYMPSHIKTWFEF